jgi:hypothetical protein
LRRGKLNLAPYIFLQFLEAVRLFINDLSETQDFLSAFNVNAV